MRRPDAAPPRRVAGRGHEGDREIRRPRARFEDPGARSGRFPTDRVPQPERDVARLALGSARLRQRAHERRVRRSLRPVLRRPEPGLRRGEGPSVRSRAEDGRRIRVRRERGSVSPRRGVDVAARPDQTRDGGVGPRDGPGGRDGGLRALRRPHPAARARGDARAQLAHASRPRARLHDVDPPRPRPGEAVPPRAQVRALEPDLVRAQTVEAAGGGAGQVVPRGGEARREGGRRVRPEGSAHRLYVLRHRPGHRRPQSRRACAPSTKCDEGKSEGLVGAPTENGPGASRERKTHSRSIQ